MSITSGGRSYDPAFPVANVNNNSKGFRDNFATIKFAVENLQVASSPALGNLSPEARASLNSKLDIVSYPDATGKIILKVDFLKSGFILPARSNDSARAGSLAYEGGQLFFHNGTPGVAGWRSFIERDGDTVTLTNLVVNDRLTLNFVPSNPTDAVTMQWVEDYISALPAGGTDPAVYTRLDKLDEELADEIEARAQADNAIIAMIEAERARIDAHDTQFTTVDQQIVQVRNDLESRMDGVENLAKSVSTDFADLSQSVSNAVQQVNALGQQVEADIAAERAERIAADEALSARIDIISDVILPDLAASLEEERQARIESDAALQQGLAQTNTNLGAERDARIAAHNTQNNSINALAAAFGQANAIVMAMDERIDKVADDLVTERNNREAGDINERNARIAADNAERQAREQADTQNQQAVAAEKTAREQADEQQRRDLAAEKTARETAIAAEQSAREQADTQQRQDLAAEKTARENAVAAEQSAREQAIADEAAARDAAISDEAASRDQAIAAETAARNDAIQAEQTARNTALGGEKTAREQADAALQAQIDALEASAGNNNDYLSKSAGGTVSGPVDFNNGVSINNSSFTLKNSQFYLPQSNITIDSDRALKFSKIPNSAGSGDGAFITYEENNMRYAVNASPEAHAKYKAEVAELGQLAADRTREFACLRIGVTNDFSDDKMADNLALEPAADLFLNPGWFGDGFGKLARTQRIGISAVYVGDAYDWRLQIKRASGDLYTKGRIDADGDIVGLSDESVKDNVTRITGALDKIEALTGVLYNRNDLEGSPVQMGLIAQEVQPVVPEVVHEREDGKLGIAYANLIGLLIEGIKELRAEVQSLKK